MGKIHVEFDTEYEVGDVVVFKNVRTKVSGDILAVGMITGYYTDCDTVWYNIQMNPNFVFTYADGGDIAEFNIVSKLENKDLYLEYIQGTDNNEEL